MAEYEINEIDEIESVRAAIQGDRDAFCELYDRYKSRLYRYAVYKIGNREDAEDAVSSCVLSAWEQIGKLKSPEAFPAWLFRILRGSCSSMIKDVIRVKDDLPEDALDNKATENGFDSDAHLMLVEALGTLPEDSREMVLLSVVGGLKSGEIGEIFGMPQGTVRSRVSRSLAAMREVLEAENE